VARLDLADPVTLVPGATYMISLLAKGSDSFVGEDCVATLAAGGVRIHVLPYESANGSNEARGQIPELYVRPLGRDA
jgi:hypothetical protein